MLFFKNAIDLVIDICGLEKDSNQRVKVKIRESARGASGWLQKSSEGRRGKDERNIEQASKPGNGG